MDKKGNRSKSQLDVSVNCDSRKPNNESIYYDNKQNEQKKKEPIINICESKCITKVTPEDIQDNILFESELKKYQPGISIKYISRWCQITRTQFMYFTNNWSANCWLTKPLMIIPLEYIKLVQKVLVNTEPKKKVDNKQIYQFEVFLMDDVDIFKLNSFPQFKKNKLGRMKKKYEESKECTNEFGISFKCKEEENSFRVFVQENYSDLKAIKYEENIPIKHISGWMSSLSSTLIV